MDKLRMQTQDKAEENFKKLAEMFPGALTETIGEDGKLVRAINVDVLRRAISSAVVEGQEEDYQFTWPGKWKSLLLANAPTNKTLRPVKKDSLDFDSTQNLYIEGDNLEVLKLLQRTYSGKVKMIYIDPPYNTGNDFIYNDNFTQSKESFEEASGARDEEGNRLFQNLQSNGRFHSDWCSMICPRLMLARELLRDDGVIFISIDDNEQENLKKICDEVFGAGNFIGTIVVKSNPRGSMSISELAILHEYVLLYSKRRIVADIIGHGLSSKMSDEYKYFDVDKRRYRLLGLRMRGGFWRRSDRPNLYFPIYVDPETSKISVVRDKTYTEEVFPIQPSTNEEGTWRWGKEKIKAKANLLIAKQISRSGDKVWDIFQKDYYDTGEGRRTKAKSIWDDSEVNYQNGTTEIKTLFVGGGVFDYSKPVFLVAQMMRMIGHGDGDIILDFFSGSATTAHAVMQLNAEDGGHRKFIMVQLPEKCDEGSEAAKAGYKNICEIGKERIRRAGKKILEENPSLKGVLDVGFRVLKIDSTNMEDVYYTASSTEQGELAIDNVKQDRTPLDLLFQVMLEFDKPLSSKIEEIERSGKKVFHVDGNDLICCFDENISDDVVKEIAMLKPGRVVFRDSSFASDSVRINCDQLFAKFSPSTKCHVI